MERKKESNVGQVSARPHQLASLDLHRPLKTAQTLRRNGRNSKRSKEAWDRGTPRCLAPSLQASTLERAQEEPGSTRQEQRTPPRGPFLRRLPLKEDLYQPHQSLRHARTQDRQAEAISPLSPVHTEGAAAQIGWGWEGPDRDAAVSRLKVRFRGKFRWLISPCQ